MGFLQFCPVYRNIEYGTFTLTNCYKFVTNISNPILTSFSVLGEWSHCTLAVYKVKWIQIYAYIYIYFLYLNGIYVNGLLGKYKHQEVIYYNGKFIPSNIFGSS